MIRDDLLIDTRYGDINGDLKCEKVTLIGVSFDKDSPYMTGLRLLIEQESGKSNFNIDMEGYQFNLFLGDFLKTNSNQILITGQYGGSGGYATFRLYQYKNNKLKLILSDAKLSNQLNYSAKYLDDYKLKVSLLDTKKTFEIDLSNNFKGYLDLVYDTFAKASKGENPTISSPNSIYPIMLSYNNYYSLQIQQRIIGVSNSDILGAIQSVLDVDDNGYIYVKEQYFLLIDRNNI